MKHAYALAIVVRRRSPASAHVGDRAIVHADGRMDGFIGGACSRETVRRAALEALETGEPRLLSIDPMSCASEGAIDVYIEPELPRPYFLIAGLTPIAHALAEIAPKLDFTVVRFVHADELLEARTSQGVLVMDIADLDEYLRGLDAGIRHASAAIAISHGNYDEAALTAFLKHRIGYTALVASRQRGRSVLEALAKQRVSVADLERVHYPAGIAIGAQRPSDVAISIFAEVIAERQAPTMAPTVAVDPVCGMSLEVAAALDRAVFNGNTYYFCGSHCSSAFASEPETYVGAASKSL